MASKKAKKLKNYKLEKLLQAIQQRDEEENILTSTLNERNEFYEELRESLNTSFTESEITNLIKSSHELLFNENLGWFEYLNGYWNHTNENSIKQMIRSYMGKTMRVTGNKIGSILRLLEADCNIPDLEFNKSQVINFQNGTFELEGGKFRNHSKLDYVDYKLPYPYDEDADCEDTLNFLKESLESEESITVIQEYLGYCLFDNCSMEKALFLLGNGANGKSVFINLIEALFGKTEDKTQGQIISSLDIAQLNTRFKTIMLYGKRINATNEIGTTDKNCIEQFKRLVSGNTLTGERKGKQPFDFTSIAKWIIACNELPRTMDYSDGFLRRMLIITFPYKFVDEPSRPNEKKIDRKLTEKLCTPYNLAGTFKWVYEGYLKLQKNMKFSITENMEESIVEYRKETDYVYDFLSSWDWGSVDDVTAGGLYEDYKHECEIKNNRPVSSQTFKTQISKIHNDCRHDMKKYTANNGVHYKKVKDSAK